MNKKIKYFAYSDSHIYYDFLNLFMDKKAIFLYVIRSLNIKKDYKKYEIY